jgi:hypothetical protein
MARAIEIAPVRRIVNRPHPVQPAEAARTTTTVTWELAVENMPDVLSTFPGRRVILTGC